MKTPTSTCNSLPFHRTDILGWWGWALGKMVQKVTMIFNIYKTNTAHKTVLQWEQCLRAILHCLNEPQPKRTINTGHGEFLNGHKTENPTLSTKFKGISVTLGCYFPPKTTKWKIKIAQRIEIFPCKYNFKVRIFQSRKNINSKETFLKFIKS